MRMKLLTTLLVGLFCLAGIQSAAIARDDCGGCSLEKNAESLESAIKFTEEALEHAKQGHGKEAKASTKAARAALKGIVSTRGGRLLQKPRTRIIKAGIAAGKGDTNAAVPLLEEAVEQLKKVDLTPE